MEHLHKNIDTLAEGPSRNAIKLRYKGNAKFHTLSAFGISPKGREKATAHRANA